jgi:hypothetical protein
LVAPWWRASFIGRAPTRPVPGSKSRGPLRGSGYRGSQSGGPPASHGPRSPGLATLNGSN